MKHRWFLADLLDLEYFLSQDQEHIDMGRSRELAERDREIYLNIKDSCEQDASSVSMRCLLLAWVNTRRASFVKDKSGGQKRILPGEVFQELIRLCGWGLFLTALLVGWTMAMAFLSYSGTTPVNVAIFLALFVVSQLFVLGILLFLLAFGRLAGHLSLPATCSALRKLFFRLAVRLGRLSAANDVHQWLVILFGQLRRQKKIYGILLALPFFLLIQLAGIGFNIGVLSATLLKVLATDIAFGWQSTLQLGSEVVFQLVRFIALPWAWIVPERFAYPDLLQISGSQMVLKDGIYPLSTTDLVSWWPFLCLAVAVYGLLPRVLLFFAGRLASRSLLRSLKFNAAAPQQVLQRMLTPRLSTESRVEKSVHTEKKAPRPVQKKIEPQVNKQVVVLVPDEIFPDSAEQELTALVVEKIGLKVDRCLRVDIGDEDALQELAALHDSRDQKTDLLLVLQEAWQPPIEDFFYFLRQLRTLLGDEVLFSILLIGKPKAATLFTEVREQDYVIWQQKIAALGDPYLQCVRLVE